MNNQQPTIVVKHFDVQINLECEFLRTLKKKCGWKELRPYFVSNKIKICQRKTFRIVSFYKKNYNIIPYVNN